MTELKKIEDTMNKVGQLLIDAFTLVKDNKELEQFVSPIAEAFSSYFKFQKQMQEEKQKKAQ